METTRPKGGGEATSEVYECDDCRKTFVLHALLLNRLKVLLSSRMGAEVELLDYQNMHRIHWFRVLLQDARSEDVRTPPMLGISQERLEDGRPIEQIWGDLEDLQVPERLKKYPEQALCYSRVGAVEECDPRR